MKMFVIDEHYGDYHRYGPYETVRLDSLTDEDVTLLCDGDRITVTPGFVIVIDEEE